MQIVPMKDLKDTTKIENLCVESQSPVFVTKNGYGKLVVMDIEYFERIMNKVYEAKIINEGIEDVINGHMIDGKDVMEAIGEKYGF